MDFSPTDLLNMPQEISDMIRAILRENGMTADEIAVKFDMMPDQVREKLSVFVQNGTLRTIIEKETMFYKISFRKKKPARKTSEKLLRILDDL